MINFKKSGFSLAEILIALVIIAVVITISISMSKSGIKRAYDLYYYTGTVGISEAIADAKSHSLNLQHVSDNSTLSIGNSKFIKHILRIMSVSTSENDSGGGSLLEQTSEKVRFIVPNGITYEISTVTPNDDSRFIINMTLPTTKGSQQNTVTFLYVPVTIDANGDQVGFDILIPQPPQSPDSPNLLERVDLLPCYIDDGIEGKVDSNGKYHKIVPRSIKEALCRTYGATNLNNSGKLTGTEDFDCTNIPQDDEPSPIRFINPRKVF